MSRLLISVAVALGFALSAAPATAQTSLPDFRYSACAARIASTFDKDMSLADSVREFVYGNSIHADGELLVTSTNPFAIVGQLCDVWQSGAAKPHLLCGHRAQAMQAILSAFGVRARTVYLFSEWNGPGELYGHVLVEVLDPQTGEWQVQDPDYNVEYKRGHNLSISQIVAMRDRAGIVPTNSRSRGWAATGALPLLNGDYFSIAYIPQNGMLYYDQAASESSLVTRVGEYIQDNMPNAGMTAALIGRSD